MKRFAVLSRTAVLPSSAWGNTFSELIPMTATRTMVSQTKSFWYVFSPNRLLTVWKSCQEFHKGKKTRKK